MLFGERLVSLIELIGSCVYILVSTMLDWPLRLDDVISLYIFRLNCT